MDTDFDYSQINVERFEKYNSSSLDGNPSKPGWYFATVTDSLVLLRWWNGSNWSFPVSMLCRRIGLVARAALLRAPANQNVYWLELEAGLPDNVIIEKALIRGGYVENIAQAQKCVAKIKKHFKAFMKAQGC